MDTESQRIYDRMRLHRQMGEHPSWNAAQLAEAIGRSARWGRKWVTRLKSETSPSFKMYQSQSCAPKRRPRQTEEPVKEAICTLRERLSAEYHRPAGARLIAQTLQKETALQESQAFIPTSNRTINKILRERGYIQDAPKREHLPLDLCAPMEEWEVDFCEIRLQDGRFEFFLVVDRGTSRVVYLEGCGGYRADSALMAVYRLLEQHGLPTRLRMDRDPRFVWSWSADGFPAPLIRFLQVLGVEPVICPPRRPDKKPYVERCVRTFKYEWLHRFTLETMADCYAALEGFAHYHNAQRLHLGRACRGRTPDEAFPTLPDLPRLPHQVLPNDWLPLHHGRVFRRTIRANGTFQLDKHLYYLDAKLAHRHVLLHLDARHRCLLPTLDGKPLARRVPLKGLYSNTSLDLPAYLKHLQHEALTIAAYRHSLWYQSAETA
jgi:hypothetical protein